MKSRFRYRAKYFVHSNARAEIIKIGEPVARAMSAIYEFDMGVLNGILQSCDNQMSKIVKMSIFILQNRLQHVRIQHLNDLMSESKYETQEKYLR